MFSVSRMKIDIHFSLIAAAVTYIMWKSVGEDKIKKMEGKKLDDDDFKKRKGYWRVDCQSASKGTHYNFILLCNSVRSTRSANVRRRIVIFLAQTIKLVSQEY